MGQTIGYRSAGTIEFLYEPERESFYFLEVNTRLQVEHPVTEEVTGIDLVEWMIRLAAGQDLPLDKDFVPEGHAIEARIYAENAARNFQPSAGLLTHVEWGADARIDGWVETGTEVTSFYDPMLAKVIAKGRNRDEAKAGLQKAIGASRLDGLTSNLDYVSTILNSPAFSIDGLATAALKEVEFRPQAVEVVGPGAQTTVQDWPGRLGYWDVGVPPSGPMDSVSFRLLNRLLGNGQGAPGLEILMQGPTLRFCAAGSFALGGADVDARLNGVPIDMWRVVEAAAGDLLEVGAVRGAGQRSYLCFGGGIDAPETLGSAATFTLGGFGGLTGRPLLAGDMLPLYPNKPYTEQNLQLTSAHLPQIKDEWQLRVLYGPHGAPDFFTECDIDLLFSHSYEVHFNSSRTGVRLIGPKPDWARPDGGEAGLHPSNLHDNAYAIGAIDFTGDMPVILGPDGPSLGGFVCPAVVIDADLWKLGQMRPGQKVRLVAVSADEADEIRAAQDRAIADLAPMPRSAALSGGGAAKRTGSPSRRGGRRCANCHSPRGSRKSSGGIRAAGA